MSSKWGRNSEEINVFLNVEQVDFDVNKRIAKLMR